MKVYHDESAHCTTSLHVPLITSTLSSLSLPSSLSLLLLILARINTSTDQRKRVNKNYNGGLFMTCT